MKALLVLLAAWGAVLTAAAQTADPAPSLAAPTQALSAIWRPIEAARLGDAAATTAACAGANQEIDAMDALMPAVITEDSLASVRGLHGLTVVPGDQAGYLYFFPPAAWNWFASGMGRIAVDNQAEGRLTLRDAHGAIIPLQLGRAGRISVLRVQPPAGAPLLTLIGCAPTNG